MVAGNQGVLPGNMSVPELYDVLDKLAAQGYVVKADTYEELAGKMSVDAATFTETMDNYAGYCETGADGGAAIVSAYTSGRLSGGYAVDYANSL